MTFLRWTTLALYMFCWIDSSAQSYTLISYEMTDAASTEGQIGATSLRYSRFGAGFAVPFSLNAGRMVAGLRYDRLAFDYVEWPPELPAPRSLHHVRLELIFIRPLSDSWQGTLAVMPGWASSFGTTLHAEDFNIAVASIVTRRWSERMTAGIGLSFVKDRAPLVIPLIQLLWSDGKAWLADMLLPSRAHLWRNIRDRLDLGIAWRAGILPYNVSFSRNEQNEGLLRRQIFSLGAALRIPIRGNLSLQSEGGLTLRNRFSFISEEKSQDLDHDPSLFVWVGLVLPF